MPSNTGYSITTRRLDFAADIRNGSGKPRISIMKLKAFIMIFCWLMRNWENWGARKLFGPWRF